MKVRWLDRTASERSEYARKEEFVSVFEREQVAFERLAILLTANSEAVKRCLVRAYNECVASTSVSKEWVLSWARRAVIRNAISFVMGAESEPVVEAKVGVANGSMTVGRDEALDVIAGPESILSLPELDRLVFVICVLERYSLHDCALLLGRSIREINEAQQRVCNLTGPFDEPSDMSQHLAVR